MLCHRQSDSLGDATHERPPWEAYATLLSPLGYGYPRYYPQAGNSQHEIAIGDVAFFEPGGQYIRILNVFQPATSAVNTCFGITDPFERLNIEDFAIEDLTLQMPLVLGSEGVTAVPEKGWDISSNDKLYLHCKMDYAAFMMLPTRTVKVQKLHAPEGTIESFVSRNHLYWNRLGADFDIGQRRNEVFFVTSWMKTTHWLGGICYAGARDRTFTFDRYGLVKVSEGPSSF
ncbi:hypothetical protein WOLCODRAFT_139342 [Wolfiporia cocos MD-104 SS10]|uniref:Uncharacterized protein n=1 Tax=Wolfiporia cocos (strain MD-104) TaxID=742152 RepID=A0A2H3JSM3_WOLCO|nr:hypothetical protein WOLCODRAFT_139342 [Wolfiporia cocos MD-104 SS10]